MCILYIYIYIHIYYIHTNTCIPSERARPPLPPGRPAVRAVLVTAAIVLSLAGAGQIHIRISKSKTRFLDKLDCLIVSDGSSSFSEQLVFNLLMFMWTCPVLIAGRDNYPDVVVHSLIRLRKTVKTLGHQTTSREH